MRRHQLLFLIVVTLGMSLPLGAASLEEARQLHEDGKTQEALAAIESVLSSGAVDMEKAASLDLLGTIAVDEGQLVMAKEAWSRLMDEYPDYAASSDTATKLSLVSALLKTEKAPAVAETVVKEGGQEEAALEEVAEAPSEKTAEPAALAVPAPAVAAESSSPEPMAVPAPTAAPSEGSDVVLVAARGKPHDAVKELSDRVVAYLRDQGVDAVSATGGIPVVEKSKMVLPLLLQKGQQDSAGSVLLLTADFVSMQKVALDCYLPEGAKLWKMKVTGGTGWKGRPYTKTGITEGLAERFMEKLDKKVGEPGLPVSLQ